MGKWVLNFPGVYMQCRRFLKVDTPDNAEQKILKAMFKAMYAYAESLLCMWQW